MGSRTISTDDLIKFVIENCTRNLNYELIELQNINNGIIGGWSAIKPLEDGHYEVIVFVEDNYNLSNDYWIKSNISKSFNDISIELIRLTKIIFIKNKEDSNNLVQYTSNSSLIEDKNNIFIDYYNNKLLNYTQGQDELVNIILYYLNNKVNKDEKGLMLKIKESGITSIIIICNAFMYLVTAILSRNLIDSNVNVLVLLGAKVNSLIQMGQYYRLITCMFLHGGVMHLLLNMYALYAIGPVIEKVYGKKRYLIIYFISGICSSILSYICSPHISIGASGAIFGLLGACLVIAIRLKKQVGKQFVTNIISVIFVNLIIGFSVSNVDNFGHLGGLIGGIIISFLIWKSNI